MKRSLRAEELSLPARCLCGVSQMLRLILPSPAPLRDWEQVKHSQLPRTIEYLWIPLITEAGTIPTSLGWRCSGPASWGGSGFAPTGLGQHLELLSSGQGRWQSPAAAPGMEISHSCSCTAFWDEKYKLICLGSREAASPGESVLTSPLISHHRYPIISLHLAFVSTSRRRASSIQTPKQRFFPSNSSFFSCFFFSISPAYSNRGN